MGNANGVRGEITYTLGDKELVLVPSFGRVAQIEKALGRSMIRISAEVTGNYGLTIDEIVTFLELANHEEIKRKELGDLVMEAGVIRALAPIKSYLARFLVGGGEEDADENPTYPAQGNDA